MSGLFGWSSTQFDKLLEKATSHLLLEPDWDAILQICDCVRQGDVQPKYAVSCIKKKLYAQNPHVVLYTLQVLESCVKNCGSPIHAEIANRPFMEELRDLVKNTTNENVRNRILELVQAWAHAFRNQPKYRAVLDIFNLLRMEGYKLQVLKESDAMFAADTAPDWADGDCCHRCRVPFSVVQRKHHCRNCGQIFCQKCSSHTSPIPRFGIEKEVRVCDACWENLSKPNATKGGSNVSSTESSPKHAGKQQPAVNPTPPGGKTEQELKEEEELQLALALSQSEAECKEKEHKPPMNKSPVHSYSPPDVNDVVKNVEPIKKGILAPTDSELERYLNRSYWEQRQQQHTPINDEDDEAQVTAIDKRSSPIPSAPAPAPATSTGLPTVNSNSNKVNEMYQNGDDDEMSNFLANLRTTLEIFVNRMRSNSSRGRPIANDTYVQSLFMNITNMHSQLLKYIQEQEDSRAYYESLQDKLNQVRDARAALDALRAEHQERLRREAEEAERQRQIQMAQKLEIMRKQKQEYLQYQRQLALQRIQEQEREMQMRHEQQKQQYKMNAVPASVAAVYPTQQQQPQQQQYVPPGSQAYVSVQGPPGSMVMGPHPYPTHTYRPAAAGNAVPPQHMTTDYQQPYSMTVVPQNVQYPQMQPQQQPQQQQLPPQSAASSSAAAVTTAQNPAIMMHPGVITHIPGNMMPPVPNAVIQQQQPQSMPPQQQQQRTLPPSQQQRQQQQHPGIPVTSSVPNSIHQHVPPASLPQHVAQTLPQHIVAPTVPAAPSLPQHPISHAAVAPSVMMQHHVPQPAVHPSMPQQQAIPQPEPQPPVKEKEEEAEPLIVFD